MVIHLVPPLLGDGIRLFDNLGPDRIRLVQTQVTTAPGDLHLRYRFMREEDFHRVVNFPPPVKGGLWAPPTRRPEDRVGARVIAFWCGSSICGGELFRSLRGRWWRSPGGGDAT
jgi:hypothetical protein